jgi:hypothetical protein
MFVQPPPVSGFEHMMEHISNQILWILLKYSRDGSWILNGMIAQSLVIMHDGPYINKVSPDICSAGDNDILQDCQGTVQVYMGQMYVICWRILRENPGGVDDAIDSECCYICISWCYPSGCHGL